MVSPQRYSFDTSSILNGRRDLLPAAVFPSLWKNIEDMIKAGAIRCVDEVRTELVRRDDDAAHWAKAQKDLFVPLEEDVQDALAVVMGKHQNLVKNGGQRSGADPWVIALAMARGGAVVTEETFSGNLAKPRIPDVCQDLEVPCLPLIDFVRQQGWVFL